MLQADGSELLPVSRCQQTPCSPSALRPSLPKMVLKTEEMSNSAPGSRGCYREEWGLGWVGAGSWGAAGEWNHLGAVGLATVVLRSSLTLGMYLHGLCCDSQILHGRGGAPSDPPKILHGRGDAPSDPPQILHGRGMLLVTPTKILYGSGDAPGAPVVSVLVSMAPTNPWCFLRTRVLGPAPLGCFKPPCRGCVPTGVCSSPPFPRSGRVLSPSCTSQPCPGLPCWPHHISCPWRGWEIGKRPK